MHEAFPETHQERFPVELYLVILSIGCPMSDVRTCVKNLQRREVICAHKLKTTRAIAPAAPRVMPTD